MLVMVVSYGDFVALCWKDTLARLRGFLGRQKRKGMFWTTTAVTKATKPESTELM